jgi:hypothetical protein
MVVSGLLWLGNPGRLLEAAAHGKITLYTSAALRLSHVHTAAPFASLICRGVLR